MRWVAVPSSGVLPERTRSAFRTLVVLLLTCVFAGLGAGAAAGAGGTLPLAHWDALSASGSTITVAGWALDRDVPKAAVQVHVYVDGRGVALTADRSRPDVDAAFPGAGSAHGFSLARTAATGVHRVCVYAIDVDDQSRNTPLGCRSVTVPFPPPIGEFEDAWVGAGPQNSGETVFVSGWTLYPGDPSVPADVEIVIDGQLRLVTPAVESRPDVGSAHPGMGDDHGFSEAFPVSQFSFAPGVHSVCVWTQVMLPTERLESSLGCRQVTVPA